MNGFRVLRIDRRIDMMFDVVTEVEVEEFQNRMIADAQRVRERIILSGERAQVVIGGNVTHQQVILHSHRNDKEPQPIAWASDDQRGDSNQDLCAKFKRDASLVHRRENFIAEAQIRLRYEVVKRKPEEEIKRAALMF